MTSSGARAGAIPSAELQGPRGYALAAVAYLACVLVNSLVTMQLVESQVAPGVDQASVLRVRVALLSAAILAPVRDFARVVGWSMVTALVAKGVDENVSWDRVFRMSFLAEVASVIGWTAVGLASLVANQDLFQHQLATIGIPSTTNAGARTALVFMLMLVSPGSLAYAAYLGWTMRRGLKWRWLSVAAALTILPLVRAALSVYSNAVMTGG